LVIEASLVISVEGVVSASNVGTHVWLQSFIYCNTSSVCDLVCGGILLGGNCSGIDVLTVGKNEGPYTTISLVWIEPSNSFAFWVSNIENLD